jgi:HAD superfamily hydrolase (TIGR01549 family)
MVHVNLSHYEGYIFDLDGTLADSMPFHFRAWKESLEKFVGTSEPFTEEFCYQNAGRPAKDIIEWLNEHHGWNMNLQEFVSEKERHFMGYLREIQPIAPVVEVVKSLGKDARQAVASGGLHRDARLIVRQLGLEPYFRAIVGSDHVPEGKPAPDTFLRAAELMEVAPKRCLVFEDAPSGFAAARAAGMDCIDVRPFYTKAKGISLHEVSARV